jgi:abortive infection bacteriophage resistance protein
MIYNKPPLTYAQQIALMESRGLLVPDNPRAQRYLQEISYYRLSAYCLPYQQIKDTFNPNTTFDNILDNYLFDRELRIIIFDVIERIEVAIRAQIIYQLAHKYGSHWQDRQEIFNPSYLNNAGVIVDVFEETQKIIKDNCNAKHPEVFIKHYITNYVSPSNPPSWMSIELLTIGQLSRLFTAIKDNKDRKDIAAFFGLHHTVFTSWLHAITYVRNICAHHSRLWNREFAIKPEILLKPQKPWMQANFNNNNDRCFYFLSTLKYLLGSANPKNHLKNKLTTLIRKYPTVPIRFLGIPSDANGNPINWGDEPLWVN